MLSSTRLQGLIKASNPVAVSFDSNRPERFEQNDYPGTGLSAARLLPCGFRSAGVWPSGLATVFIHNTYICFVTCLSVFRFTNCTSSAGKLPVGPGRRSLASPSHPIQIRPGRNDFCDRWWTRYAGVSSEGHTAQASTVLWPKYAEVVDYLQLEHLIGRLEVAASRLEAVEVILPCRLIRPSAVEEVHETWEHEPLSLVAGYPVEGVSYKRQ